MRRNVATFVAAAPLVSTVVGPVAARGTSVGADGAWAAPTAAAGADAANPDGRWIVLYRGGTDAEVATARRSAKVGFRADRTFTHGIRGFAASLTADQVAVLRHDAGVAAVIPDERIEV